MIGFYNYTVVLTYLSFVSAICGSVVATAGSGHPYIGGFFLLFCGFCDTFDGVVARSKKNRSEREKVFGAQIDSLSDLTAFGVLPCSIAIGLLTSHDIPIIPFPGVRKVDFFLVVFIAVLVFYALAALIRLAWFNMLDEELRAKGESTKGFEGLPVTMAALIFPFILMLNYLLPLYLGYVYLVVMVITGILFICRFKIKKPGRRGRNILLAIGAVEFLLLLISLLLRLKG